MSPEQCRAARAWLDWFQDELAAKAQVSNSTLRDFEASRRVPIANNLLAIRRALEEAGMQFLFSRGDDNHGASPNAVPASMKGKRRVDTRNVQGGLVKPKILSRAAKPLSETDQAL